MQVCSIEFWREIMKVSQIAICGVMLALLAGCSSIGSKQVDYRSGAAQKPALEVPPDLTAPGTDERYRVSIGDGESATTFSDYSKSGTAVNQGGSAVLPEAKGVRLERSGTQRWLVVNDTPDRVWSVLKAFCQENGLAIDSEDQAAGLLETGWIEKHAVIPQDAIRDAAGKAPALSLGVRDQYHVRLERSSDGVSTGIYVTHRGMKEVLTADGKTSKWQATPNDPEMEAAMLQRLMVRFGGSEAQVASIITPQAATIREISDGGTIILVNDTFDRSWRRVGLAIERAELTVEDKDRTRGIYFLGQASKKSGWLDKIKVWKSSKGDGMRYRVNVKDGGKVCEVSVTDQNGASNDDTRLMIDAIYRNINQ